MHFFSLLEDISAEDGEGYQDITNVYNLLP